jgi:hypothetical protein
MSSRTDCTTHRRTPPRLPRLREIARLRAHPTTFGAMRFSLGGLTGSRGCGMGSKEACTNTEIREIPIGSRSAIRTDGL